MQCDNKKTIGIICNGGAFWGGAFSSGFLNALRINNVQIDKYVGASSGFYACFSSIAGCDGKNFWSEPHAPLYKNKHNFNVFQGFVDYYTPKIFIETSWSKTALLKELDSRLFAIAAKISFHKKVLPRTDHVLLSGIKSEKDLNDIQMASGSLPWFLWPWPKKYKGGYYLDGVAGLAHPERFLDTDIKILVQPHIRARCDDRSVYAFCSDKFPKLSKLVNSKPHEIEENWQKGHDKALRFINDNEKILGLK